MPILNSAYQEIRVTATPTVYTSIAASATINNASGYSLPVVALLHPSKSVACGALLQEQPHIFLGINASLAYPGTNLLVDATLRGMSNQWLNVTAILGHQCLLPCDANLYPGVKLLTTAALASSTYEDFPANASIRQGHDLPAHVSISLTESISATATLTVYEDVLATVIISTPDQTNLPATATLRSIAQKNISVDAILRGTLNSYLPSSLTIRKKSFRDFECSANLFKNDSLKCKLEVSSVYKYLSNIKVVLVRTLGDKMRYITDVKTDINSIFTFTNIPAGDYQLAAVDTNYRFMPLTYNITVTDDHINHIEIYAFSEFVSPPYINYTPKLTYSSGYTVSGRVIFIDSKVLLFGCLFHKEDVTRFTSNFISKKK